MKLTTKGRYAVTALLDMALLQQQGPVTIPDIARRHHLSPAYLERLAGKLRQKGLLNSVRGAHGGYLLGKTPQDISIADIIKAVDEKMDTTRCQGQANCHEGGICLTHHLWETLNDVIFDFLQNITLQDLMQKPKLLNKVKALPLPTKISIELMDEAHES